MSLEDIETRRVRADWALRANYHEEASADFAALVKFAKAVKVALETPIGDDLEHDDHVYLEWAYNRIDMVQAALNELEQDA